MTFLIIAGFVIVLILAGTAFGKRSRDSKGHAKYNYARKNFIMTKAENEFFDVIRQTVGNEYLVFPQVHLSGFLDHKIKGQSWTPAFRFINQKSVDYLICDKTFRKPLLAIELDDWSHDSEDRKERDATVERVLQEAGMPLLRFRNLKTISLEEVASQIRANL